MDDNAQQLLLIASRIHHALLRYLGEGIDVGAMLANDDSAREVLYFCAGCGDEELNALGRQFELLQAAAASAACRPVMLGTSTEWRTPLGRGMAAITAALSAICGTHFGLT
jgi:hypothetical protein